MQMELINDSYGIQYSYFLSTIISKNHSHKAIGPCIESIKTSSHVSLISPFQFVLSLSILLALHYRYRNLFSKDECFLDPIINQSHRIIHAIHWNNRDYRSLLYKAVCFIGFCGIFPILCVLWSGSVLHRWRIHRQIMQKYGSKFKGFLSGPDAVWALEDDFAKSVINVMVVLEWTNDCPSSAVSNEKLSADILLALRKRLSSRLLGDYKPFPKMFYTRMRESGFTFWTDKERFSIEDYVRYMPDNQHPKNHLSSTADQFGHLCNKSLPYDHSASWEVLVSKHPVSNGPISQIPALFRIHHSLGDGVSLLRLFLETVADRNEPKLDYWAICSRSRPSITKLFQNDISKQVDIQINKFSNFIVKYMQHYRKLKTMTLSLLQTLAAILNAPASIINQSIYQKVDENSLHNRKLQGDKIVAWRSESCIDGNLISAIKLVKNHYPEARFSDVFLTALSISFEKYFARKGEDPPQFLTAVIPARIAREEPILKLQNKFSVGLQSLPIKSEPCHHQATKMYNKIQMVKKHSQILRTSYDYLVNFGMMTILPALLPANKLGNFLESPHCTLAVSNLPGPQTMSKIKGFVVRNITFWVPNRGSTGIGISILSYANKLHLGLIADKAIIDNREDAEFLLENTVHELKNMASMSYLYHSKSTSCT